MSEARRLIQQGAVRVDGERIADPHFVFPPTQERGGGAGGAAARRSPSIFVSRERPAEGG